MTKPIPDAALDDRLAFVGTSGSGKTYNAGGAVERLLSSDARVVIVDPLDVWWGLRLSSDGRSASKFSLPIFGGAHGDLPLNEHAGKLIGETVATMAESCIVSLGGLPSKSAERRFMLAFLEAVYRHAPGDPVHLIFDEADLWAPQKSSEPMLQSRMEEIVRRGRVRGFIPWLITQRPAVLSKDVLSQVDGLVTFKLTSSQDRDAIGNWVEGQADKDQWRRIWSSMPTLQRGTGVVWLPARGILETAKFPTKQTFDSSRTPKRGEKRNTATLKPVDLGRLKEKLATVESETKANDPAALKAELAKLRKDLAGKSPQSVADPQAKRREYERGLAEGLAKGEGRAKSALSAVVSRVEAALETAKAGLASLDSSAPPTVIQRQVFAPPVTSAPRPSAQSKREGNPTHLPPGELAVLIAAAQFGSVEREQLTILTGYKRSSRDAYIQRLREKQFVTVSGPTVTPTDAGLAALPADYDPLPTGAGLQGYWLSKLPEGERRVLEVLIAAYPNSVERADIDVATGYQRSSRDAYLQRMKAKRLWEKDGSTVRASEALFG